MPSMHWSLLGILGVHGRTYPTKRMGMDPRVPSEQRSKQANMREPSACIRRLSLCSVGGKSRPTTDKIYLLITRCGRRGGHACWKFQASTAPSVCFPRVCARSTDASFPSTADDEGAPLPRSALCRQVANFSHELFSM